jgi:hypothetical protein
VETKTIINMDNFRRNYNEDIHGQWRANASEKVVYTEDFPAAMLCATEFSDNSLAKGKATRIEITFDITNPESGIFTHTDNGVGIERVADLSRFLKFGSTQSSDAYHQYAWGRFRAMTAFMPEYEHAEWSATFKLCKNPNTLSQISQPWSTPENMQRSIVDIPVTESNRDVGFEMMMKFNMSIFGVELAQIYTDNPSKLFYKMKQRLTMKYPESVFEKTEFILNVKKGDHVITESSRTHNWKTLEQKFQNLTVSSPASCRKVFDEVLNWKSIKARVTEYHLSRDNLDLKREFPIFGERCIPGQRVHNYVQDRLIESRSKPKMDKRDGHNTQNGEIVFIHAYSADAGCFADLPTPSTTKVSIKDDCPNLPGIYQMYLARKKQIEDQKKAEQKEREKEAREKRKAEAAAAAAAASAAAAAKAAAAPKAITSLRLIKSTTTTKNQTAGGGDSIQKIPSSLLPVSKPDQVASASSEQQSSSQEENEPTSPSMPSLDTIPASFAETIAATTSTTAPNPVLPKSTYTLEDMREVMQMALILLRSSPESAALFKSQTAERFGI